MFRNYLKIAFRTLLRHKSYSFINIAGLTLGLTCCLLIFQYVAFEYSFDAFNTNAPELYRVTQTSSRNGSAPETSSHTGYALGPALAQHVPEIVRYARIHPDYNNLIVSNPAQPDQVFEETRVFYADPAFLLMFSYPMASGDAAQALTEPGTLLLSESAAHKYFGSENPIGKTLDVNGWISGAFRITGVLRDTPPNSHLQFDFLLPMENLLRDSDYRDPESGWGWQNFATYVQLRQDAAPAEVEPKLTDVLLRFRGDDLKASNITARLNAQPLHDIHLNEAVEAPKVVMGSYRTVYFFTLVGFVTLLIALINYVNLATARALDRAREVGVRKVVGAHRRQLMLQFVFESGLTNLIAFVLAIALSGLLIPVVNRLAGTQLDGALWESPWLWAAFLGTFGVGTLLAGLYPAFVLSSFKPVSVLKGKSGAMTSQLWLRRGLVVLQFSASVVLVTGMAIVYSQLDYMRRMDLGIQLDQILTVPGPRVLPESVDRSEVTRTFIDQLRNIPGIEAVATSTTLPGQGFMWYTSGLRRETADRSSEVNGVLTQIDTSFAALYGLELIAGEGFEGHSAPPSEGEPAPVLINETAALAVGLETAEDAVGEILNMGGAPLRVVGVLRDFNWSSAHTQREAAAFRLTQTGGQISLKVSAENLQQTLAAIEKTYTTLFPGNVFRYAFVDEQFNAQYQNDERFAGLFSIFAALAVIIACLGLFGLASFTAQQRTKEIGVRKVLGASVSGLITLLSTDFLKLVLVAFALGMPVSYFLMQRWLDNFAYQVKMGPSVFLIAGLAILLVALLTVSYQAVRAALADPVKSLRYE